MNDQTQTQSRTSWVGWIALLAFAVGFSPVNVHLVIAQEEPGIVVAPADPGEPPAPPQATATIETVSPEPAQAPSEVAVVAAPSQPQPPEVQEPQASAVPAVPSEVSKDSEIGNLLPTVDATKSDSASPSNSETSSKTSAKENTEAIRTLSVEPGTRPVLPKNRPAWVGAAPDFTSSQHYLYVGSLPTLKPNKADQALDEPLVAAVRNYIDQEVINQIGAANAMPVTADFIRTNLIDDPVGYECELATGQEPLYQKWVSVRITPEQRELFRQWHIEATQRTRLAPLGVGLVAVLSVISMSHLVLRRFRGGSPLTVVNQHVPVAVAKRSEKAWSSTAKWMLFALLGAAVAFAFLLPLFALTASKVTYQESTEIDSEFAEMPDLHKQIHIETLDGDHKTIILETKSHR